jgi:hypothetical protein
MFLEIFVNFHIFSVNLKQIAKMKKPKNWKKKTQFPTLANPNNLKTKYQNQCS